MSTGPTQRSTPGWNAISSPFRLLALPEYGNPDYGWLSVLDEASLPFEVKRIFWVRDVPGMVMRGSHLHMSTQQILIAARGSVHVWLSRPELKDLTYEITLGVPPFSKPMALWVWPRTMLWYKFCDTDETDPSLLLVLSDEPYDPDDEVKSWNEYERRFGDLPE